MPEVIFNGPDGRLEGRYQPGPKPTAPLALVLHPHPLYGGTMNNKVVFQIYQTFAKRGFAVLRFNFRGVGRSQGTYDNGLGELSDAAAALDYLQLVNPNANQCWIAGFSFGAWIAMQLLMRRPELAGFVAVSPPASLFDFAFLAPCPSSGLIVHGGADDLVPEAEVQKLATRLGSQRDITVDYRKIDKAGHFYEKELEEMGGIVDKYLAKSLTEGGTKAA
jgi:alpha/beta superfamily hydrolase